MAQTQATPETERSPDGSGIAWELAEHPHVHWEQERMHYPDPVGPLMNSFELSCFNVGTGRAFEEYSIPIRFRFQVVNGYVYGAEVPVSDDPEVLAALRRQADERVGEATARLWDLWEKDALPELRADVAAFRAFDYAGASDAALADHLDWVVERRIHQWYLHFRLMPPCFASVRAYADSYRSLLGATDDIEPYDLLEGVMNLTLAGGHALWRLSRLAAKSPVVRAAIEHTAPEELFERLAETPEGREFADAFRAYLDEFGWRGDSWNMDDRTWVSYPRTPQNTLRAYLAQPDEASPELAHAALVRRREAAVAAVRERLAGSPEEVWTRFERLLSAAQFGQQLHEDHNYYIDQMLQHLSRRAFLEAGRRLVVRSQVGDPEDVLHFTVDEVRERLRSTERPDLRSAVAERRAELSWQQTLTPPPELGAPKPVTQDGKGPGGGAPPAGERQIDERQIKGNAGSKGQVTGIAKVAANLAEATTLQPGEILVCPTTSPSWTPLFATAAAVVTDTGGILSHCASVAREYGIPAVVGAGGATKRIRSGQRITVDGTAGTVTLE